MSTSRETKVNYDGKTYMIPDIWIAGICQTNGCSVTDAVAFWAWNKEMEAAEAL